MLTHHIDKDNHILEITVGGDIEREELQKTLQELEGPLDTWEEIRLLKRVDSFPSMDLQSWMQDLKFGFENFSNYKKIKKYAIVTDKEWIEKIIEKIEFLLPGEVKVFENEDIEEARSWLK